MHFDENRHSAIIRCNTEAYEETDITHEPLHVRMQFRVFYPLLLPRQDDPEVTHEMDDAIGKIRNIVDDTYIFYALYNEFGIFPISRVFFRESEKEVENAEVHRIRGLPGVNRIPELACLLRIADLTVQHFPTGRTYAVTRSAVFR